MPSPGKKTPRFVCTPMRAQPRLQSRMSQDLCHRYAEILFVEWIGKHRVRAEEGGVRDTSLHGL